MILMRNYMNGGCVTVVQNIKTGDEVNNSQAKERLQIDDILNIKDLQDHEPDIPISDSIGSLVNAAKPMSGSSRYCIGIPYPRL